MRPGSITNAIKQARKVGGFSLLLEVEVGSEAEADEGDKVIPAVEPQADRSEAEAGAVGVEVEVEAGAIKRRLSYLSPPMSRPKPS